MVLEALHWYTVGQKTRLSRSRDRVGFFSVESMVVERFAVLVVAVVLDQLDCWVHSIIYHNIKQKNVFSMFCIYELPSIVALIGCSSFWRIDC